MQNANAQLHEGHREVHHRSSQLGDGQVTDTDLSMLGNKYLGEPLNWKYKGTYMIN